MLYCVCCIAHVVLCILKCCLYERFERFKRWSILTSFVVLHNSFECKRFYFLCYCWCTDFWMLAEQAWLLWMRLDHYCIEIVFSLLLLMYSFLNASRASMMRLDHYVVWKLHLVSLLKAATYFLLWPLILVLQLCYIYAKWPG